MADAKGNIKDAIKLYHDEVKAERFPATEHSFE